MTETSGVLIRAANFKTDYQAIFDVRNTVYIQGQNCPHDEEFDEYDEHSEHFLAYLGDTVVGYCRLRMVGKKAKFERFAVYETWRGKGFGKLLVDHLIELTNQRGISHKYLNAQTSVRTFYEDLGFEARGNLFWEAGIEHIAMDYVG